MLFIHKSTLQTAVMLKMWHCPSGAISTTSGRFSLLSGQNSIAQTRRHSRNGTSAMQRPTNLNFPSALSRGRSCVCQVTYPQSCATADSFLCQPDCLVKLANQTCIQLQEQASVLELEEVHCKCQLAFATKGGLLVQQ